MSSRISTQLDCISCMLQTGLKIINNSTRPLKQKHDVIRVLIGFLREHAKPTIPPIHYASDMFHLINEKLDIDDPYLEEKKISNRIALDLVPQFMDVLSHLSGKKRFEMALRIAIAGNIIDYGTAQNEIELDQLQAKIETILNKKPSINHSPQLFNKIQEVSNLLYLCDNAGEIALDKPLLGVIRSMNPEIHMTAVVKTAPISNDATLDDATDVNLIDVTNQIITTGSADLGVNPNRASREFLQLLQNSDLVISKGQSNLESLWKNPDLRSKSVGYLLVAKCSVIANALGVSINSPIIMTENL